MNPNPRPKTAPLETESIEQLLRNERLPLSGDNAPTAKQLLQRQNRQQRFTRSAGLACAVAAIAFGASQFRTPQPELSTQADPENQPIAHHTHVLEPNTAAVGENAIVISSNSNSATNSDTGARWIVNMAVPDADGRIPLFAAPVDQPQSAIPIGYLPTPEVKQVPVWQLPLPTQDEIDANWNAAGYQRTVMF